MVIYICLPRLIVFNSA